MFNHFWLICGLWCGLGNGAMIWFRRNKYVELGILSEEEIVGLAKRVAIWILVPCLILWAVQLSAGRNLTPEYWSWPAPQRYFAYGVQAIVWFALVFWVFVRDGADTLSAFYGVGSKGQKFLYSPAAIKFATILAIVGGSVAQFCAHAETGVRTDSHLQRLTAHEHTKP